MCILIVVFNFMVDYWWLIGIVVIGGLFGFWYYIKIERGCFWWDKVKMKFLIIGGIFE